MRTTEMTRTEPKREIAMRGKGVALESVEDAYRFSKMVVMSGMAPRGIDKPEKVLICIQSGAEVGLSPWQAIQSIAIINNRPCMWGDACIGLVLGSGKLTDMDSWEEGEGENFVAYFMCKRAGAAREIVRSFGWKDAKAAGLLGKDTYKSYIKRMCFNRARAFALRDGFADVLKGISVAEDVADYAVFDDAPPAPRRARKSDLLAPPAPVPESPQEPPDSPAPPPDEPPTDSSSETVERIAEAIRDAETAEAIAVADNLRKLAVRKGDITKDESLSLGDLIAEKRQAMDIRPDDSGDLFNDPADGSYYSQ